jgi:LemA protein
MVVLWIILGFAVIVAGYVWMTYNSLITLRERIREALSSIDVQLKRRTDLIPNLIETVKGYAKHEKEIFENVTKARSAILSAKTPQEKATADNMLEGALKSIFAVAENYPDLKASENFSRMQEDLTDTENKIAYSRQFYNSNVLEYNSKIKSFPAVIVANQFGFKEEQFFEAKEQDREPVKVEF